MTTIDWGAQAGEYSVTLAHVCDALSIGLTTPRDGIVATIRELVSRAERAENRVVHLERCILDASRDCKMDSFHHMQHTLYEWGKAHGWYDDKVPTTDHVLAKIALVHSELSEAVECVREGQLEETKEESGKPVGLPSELADVAIRLMNLASMLGIDLEQAIRRKHVYNLTRPHRHGGKLA